ncbi:MAG: glycosyltransferase family 9 protein, partial [Bacteroidota bacterium]
ASSESRMWEDIKWRELVEKIQSKYPVVLSAQTIQLNRVLPIASGFANVKIFESRTIIDMFALTEKAMLLITPDTSVVHIAAAYNVPTLGLYNYFQETNSKFRPVSAKSMMLTTQEGGGNLKNLSVEEVFSAFEKLITELN